MYILVADNEESKMVMHVGKSTAYIVVTEATTILSSCTLDVGSGDAGPLHFNLLGMRVESPQLI